MQNKIINKATLDSFFLSYSQIFFSTHRVFGIILVVVSFLDFWSGLMGAFSVLVSLVFAHQLGFDKKTINNGVYSYNSLLTGLGVGLLFQPSLAVYIFAFFVSLLVLLLSVAFARYFANYGLPFLSIPFLLGIWLVDLSSSSFEYLGLSDRTIFNLNELYGLGGQNIVDFYNWLTEIPLLYSIKVYLLSLGAIFFQYKLMAGLLIAIGLLIHSRISFVLSILGFYSAWFFYFILGASLYELSYSYIGFNFILTAIALGGFFLLPNRYSFSWMIIILPIVVLVTIASMKAFAYFGLGIYALPFNVVVILFLYINKLRTKEKYHLKETFIQHYSPEKNLYFSLEAEKRFMDWKYLPFSLPVNGVWSISQAHNGEFTHQDDWRHAWDFVILNAEGKQFNGDGDYLEDYICYNKNVLAVCEGSVQEVVNNVEDNIIGETNLNKNWGNTIIIKHTDGVYSKYSHLQKDSTGLQKGDYVRKGQVIAKVGNSGRSPYPHLHFQVQSTPYIGSKTMAYPFSSYLQKGLEHDDIKIYQFPQKGDQVSNSPTHELLTKMMKWEIGRVIEVEVQIAEKTHTYNWTIETDIYKNTYIHCEETQSSAYFHSDPYFTFFKNYIGDLKSPLYQLFQAFYKIHHSFVQDVVLEDEIALHLSTLPKGIRLLQDFIAPFYIFTHVHYQMKYISVDDDFTPTKMKLQSEINIKRRKNIIQQETFDIEINENGLFTIHKKDLSIKIIQKK